MIEGQRSIGQLCRHRVHPVRALLIAFLMVWAAPSPTACAGERQVDLELVLAVDASGSIGKSVLLRMVADLDPHEGDALLDGAACSGMPAPEWRRMVTYVAAESGWWHERVEAHFSPGTDFAALLPAVGIPAEARAWPVARLSTGERQRLALLRALSPENRVLLLDEPTSALDAENTGLVEALLRGRLSTGTAILLVTHDPEQATRMASRHLEVRDGQLVEETP
jgi:ABC-type iron transport system FetAB ATPase subunit